MDIDGRLDRLTERHEALAHSLELFIASSRENDKLLSNRMAQLMETMNRLGNIVISHEERLGSHDDRLDNLEGKF
jgi:uncharacterized protein YigA (DUF484 family)